MANGVNKLLKTHNLQTHTTSHVAYLSVFKSMSGSILVQSENLSQNKDLEFGGTHNFIRTG